MICRPLLPWTSIRPGIGTALHGCTANSTIVPRTCATDQLGVGVLGASEERSRRKIVEFS